MTDREKLIKLLNEAHYEFYENFNPNRGYMTALANHLLANGVALAKDTNVCSKWISVKDRLPENRKDVLVCAFWEGEWCVLLAWYGPNGRRWHVFDGVVEKTDVAVSHWMPLPEPPKEEDNGK